MVENLPLLSLELGFLPTSASATTCKPAFQFHDGQKIDRLPCQTGPGNIVLTQAICWCNVHAQRENNSRTNAAAESRKHHWNHRNPAEVWQRTVKKLCWQRWSQDHEHPSRPRPGSHYVMHDSLRNRSIVSQGTHILYAVSMHTTKMSFSAKADSSLKLEKILAFLPCSLSRSFTRCPAKVITFKASQKKLNPASQKSHGTTTLLWTCKLFQKSDSFFADFRGSVCRYFEDLSGRKVSKSNSLRAVDRLSRNRHTL